VQCPICNALVVELDINRHLDSNCRFGSHDRVLNLNSLATSSSSKNSSSSKKTDDSKSIAPIFSQKKRSIEPYSSQSSDARHDSDDLLTTPTKLLSNERPVKRQKTNFNASTIPLAERLRPKEFSEFVGQVHLTGPDSLLVHLLQGSNGSAGSMILWGPSGCGKTTLARLLARRTDATLKEDSATSSGVTDIRKTMEDAKKLLSLTGR
jgi:putative ATPase